MTAGVAVVLVVATVCGSVLAENGHDAAAVVVAVAAVTVAALSAVTRR